MELAPDGDRHFDDRTAAGGLVELHALGSFAQTLSERSRVGCDDGDRLPAFADFDGQGDFGHPSIRAAGTKPESITGERRRRIERAFRRDLGDAELRLCRRRRRRIDTGLGQRLQLPDRIGELRRVVELVSSSIDGCDRIRARVEWSRSFFAAPTQCEDREKRRAKVHGACMMKVLVGGEPSASASGFSPATSTSR